MQTRLGNYNYSHDFIANAYLEANVTPDIKIRSTFGTKLAFWGGVGFTPVFFLSSTVRTSQNNYGKNENNTFNWNIENTITYSKRLEGHQFKFLLGRVLT
jgi:hypothetical protein